MLEYGWQLTNEIRNKQYGDGGDAICRKQMIDILGLDASAMNSDIGEMFGHVIQQGGVDVQRVPSPTPVGDDDDTTDIVNN